jgi:hypothetical protein
MSQKHLSRHLNGIGFRWNHRIPEIKITKRGKKKNIDETYAIYGQTDFIAVRMSRPTGSKNP